ncbi:MAG: ClpXP protease specificity-enhancing factor SspB [Rhodospirillales bacterium]|nr:ClpXP protease specificity-enhancing factor SspB [Rhodospirillales bacterium]
MSKDLIGYNTLVENGLRSVVREALRRVAEEGWPGTHHAYITFKTAAPGVEVPDFLSTRYPDELTIVLQHQFWGLEVEDDHFSVTLSFNKVGHRVVVPFAALTSYADPSIKFGLQFGQAQKPAGKAKAKRRQAPAAVPEEVAPKANGEKVVPDPEELSEESGEALAEGGDGASTEESGDVSTEAGGEKVVALDQFRKK